MQDVAAKGLTLSKRFIQPDLSCPNNEETVSVAASVR